MNRIVERKEIKIAPALCSSDWKSFTRTQNIKDGCAFLIVEEEDAGLVHLGQPERMDLESSRLSGSEDGATGQVGCMSGGG